MIDHGIYFGEILNIPVKWKHCTWSRKQNGEFKAHWND